MAGDDGRLLHTGIGSKYFVASELDEWTMQQKWHEVSRPDARRIFDLVEETRKAAADLRMHSARSREAIRHSRTVLNKSTEAIKVPSVFQTINLRCGSE
ncbi:hypothetical protein AB7M49_006614 [Bradyrhizobium elkanii]